MSLAQALRLLHNVEKASQRDDLPPKLSSYCSRTHATDISRVLLAASYGHLGRAADARAEWAEAMRINSEYSLEHRRQVLPYRNPSDFDRMIEGLRQEGLPH